MQNNEIIPENSRIRMTVPYFQVPNAIFDLDIGLDIYQKAVYIYLCRCSNNNSTAFPSYKTIGDKCGMSKRKAIDVVKELADMKLLVKQIRLKDNNTNDYADRNDSNVYVVNDITHIVNDIHYPSAHDALPLVNDMHHPNAPCSPNKELLIKNYSIKNYIGIEGIANTSNPIQYLDDFVAVLNLTDTSYPDDIFTTVHYYLNKYRIHSGKEHVRYNKTNTKRIIRALEEIYLKGIYNEETGIYEPVEEFEYLKPIIDRHFITHYKKMDHKLLGFLNESILLHRYQEVYMAGLKTGCAEFDERED